MFHDFLDRAVLVGIRAFIVLVSFLFTLTPARAFDYDKIQLLDRAPLTTTERDELAIALGEGAPDLLDEAEMDGEANAQYALGFRMANSDVPGMGAERKQALAAHWLLSAARNAHINANTRLIRLLRDGVGVKQNPALAEELSSALPAIRQAAAERRKQEAVRQAELERKVRWRGHYQTLTSARPFFVEGRSEGLVAYLGERTIFRPFESGKEVEIRRKPGLHMTYETDAFDNINFLHQPDPDSDEKTDGTYLVQATDKRSGITYYVLFNQYGLIQPGKYSSARASFPGTPDISFQAFSDNASFSESKPKLDQMADKLPVRYRLAEKNGVPFRDYDMTTLPIGRLSVFKDYTESVYKSVHGQVLGVVIGMDQTASVTHYESVLKQEEQARVDARELARITPKSDCLDKIIQGAYGRYIQKSIETGTPPLPGLGEILPDMRCTDKWCFFSTAGFNNKYRIAYHDEAKCKEVSDGVSFCAYYTKVISIADSGRAGTPAHDIILQSLMESAADKEIGVAAAMIRRDTCTAVGPVKWVNSAGKEFEFTE